MNNDEYSQFATFGVENTIHLPDHSFIKSIVRRLDEENKDSIQYYSDPVQKTRFDIFAPEGIDNIDGPTVIEIINQPKGYNWVGKEVMVKPPQIYPIKAAKGIGAKNYLLIFTFELSPDKRKGIIDSIKNLKENIETIVWDSEDLNKYLGKKIAGDFTYIETIYESSKDNLKNQEKEREKLVESISQEYQNERLALFIGAGVSKDAGLDSWDELINKLQLRLLNKKLNLEATDSELEALLKDQNRSTQSKDHEDFFHEANKLLLDASLIKREYKDSFDLEMRNSLYQNIGDRHPIIDAIVEMCHFQNRKMNLSAIITYNYDSLIEDTLNEQNNFEFQIIHNEIMIPDLRKLPIFHVHGYLPRRINENQEPNRIIISDEDYYELYLNFYHWSNIVQLSYLRNNSCLFIGVSFKDPNLRRILYHLSKESNNPRHFAFMRRNRYQNTEPGLVREEIKSQFEALEIEFAENNLRNLGVRVIWVDDYYEIPGLLRDIKQRRTINDNR